MHDAVDVDVHRQAATLAAGRSVAPYFRFDQARVILSLDCDFIGAESDTHLHCRNFAKSRRVAQNGGSMSRLYIAEALMTQTGMNADHRLRIASSQIVAVAAAIGAAIAPELVSLSGKLPLPAGVKPEWIAECAKDLKANAGSALVVAGYRQPLAVHLIAHALNAALGANGKTVQFRETLDLKEQGITQLAADLNAGTVDTLVILGGNPVHTAPADLNWAATQRKAKTVVRLGYYEDETFTVTDLHLPAAHFLESWGDVRTADGTVVIVQPLIQPLFEGLTEIEVLARIAGLPETDPYAVTRGTFGGNDEAWKKALHDGFVANSAIQPTNIQFNAGAITQALANVSAEAPSKDRLEVVFTRDYKVDDGRWANNGWLVELPDPVTKMTWDNAVLISRKTAEDLGLANTQIVKIDLGGRTVTAPVWVQPGQADNVLGLALGFGREKGGRIANFNNEKVGFNFYPLRTSSNPTIAVGAKVTSTAGNYTFACTQDHWSMEGRPIIREANLEQFKKEPGFVKSLDFEIPPGGNESLYPNPLDWKRKEGLHQWGMAIDLNTCVGCNACVSRLRQSENNIPVVGQGPGAPRPRDAVAAHRPLLHGESGTAEESQRTRPRREAIHRKVDRRSAGGQSADAVPALRSRAVRECLPGQRHRPRRRRVEPDGLQPLRRHALLLEQLPVEGSPLQLFRLQQTPTRARALYTSGSPRSSTRRSDDEWELLKLVRNPDVSVRMRGVMEKCTFCVQRIEGAKIAQKVKAGQSGDVIVPDGTIKTACQQACPAEAIVFGNVERSEQQGFDCQGRHAQLRDARFPEHQAASDLPGAHSQSESDDAGLQRYAAHLQSVF